MKKILNNRWFLGVICFFCWSFVFGVVYGQSPLYTSNQNTYFLHGLAHAGFGYLSNDWLANTIDPLPVFSFLVQVTYLVNKSGVLFYSYYFLILGIYLFSMVGITDYLFHIRKSRRTLLVFLIVFIGMHSAAFHYFLSKIAGQPFLLEGGVANQRVLGQVFQPSTFGVFLLLSIYLFLINRRSFSLISMAIAVTFHPVYLLSAGVLVVGYMWILFLEIKRIKPPILFGLQGLILVLPVLLFTIYYFMPTSNQITQQANDILVNFRIPHHTQITQWLSWAVGVQSAIVVSAVLVTRRKKLYFVLVSLITFSLIFSLIQFVTRSETLALLYPWRLSVIFVPLSTCVVLGFVVSKIFPVNNEPTLLSQRSIQIIGIVFIGIFIFFGAARSYLELMTKITDSSNMMENFIKVDKKPNDIYLIPVKMIEFRLEVGAPAYIDYSIPYHDDEVVEWFNRFNLANYFYQRAACDVLPRLALEGVTKVVTSANSPAATCPELEEIYTDPVYRVFKLDLH